MCPSNQPTSPIQLTVIQPLAKWKLSVFVFGHFIQTSSLKPMQTVFFIIGTRKICYDYNPAWLEITWNNNSYIPGSPNDQTKWLVFRMIHVRILYYQGQKWTSWVCYLDLESRPSTALLRLLAYLSHTSPLQTTTSTYQVLRGEPMASESHLFQQGESKGPNPPDAIFRWNQAVLRDSYWDVHGT